MVANVNTEIDNTYLSFNNHSKMSLPPQNLLYPIDLWTKDNVRKWFEYCIEEYSLGDMNLNDFEMNGKALLLLNENGFKQRSNRSGDILYRALQQHQALIKSLTCQSYSYSFWPSFALSQPISYPYVSPFLSYKYPIATEPIRTRQVSTSSSSSIIACIDKVDSPSNHESESTTQVRYYKDRVDFHGEILMKPKGAKNCRILWEFLYILLEDSDYQSIIHWENREKMIFRILQADKLAALWGLQKNRISMTYEKLSRGMRYYYANNIIIKEQSKRLLYRFTRSPEEIRRSTKRSSDSIVTKVQEKIFSILKSDRSSSSSPESDDSEKPSKRKQAYPISRVDRFSQICSPNQPLNLVVPKQEHFINYKKQKFLSHSRTVAYD